MKKILFTFFAIVSLFTISSCGDNKDEPSLDEDGWIDPVFAKVLQERGYIADAKTVTPLDVASIESIDVSGEFGINPGPIESVKGLNYFTSLTELFCLNNQLTTLDISNNTQLKVLYCNNNQLSTLDISNNTQLTDLSCYANELTTLDVSNHSQLTGLDCSDNQLTSLDIVGHFFRNDHGKLYKTAETSVGLMPYSLIDHLAFPLLGDGIGIGAAFCQKSTDYATGALIMILHNVVSDQVCSSSRSECLTRTLVHVYDPAVAVYHCHRTIHPISPLGQKFIFHLKSLSVFIPSAKLIFFL